MLTENQQRNFMSTCNQRDRKWESKAHVKTLGFCAKENESSLLKNYIHAKNQHR